jgi:UDPglucose--hexose-1-phosphate uridylyltransferase
MSEFRQDLISGDWALIAPGRGARPQMLEKKRLARKPAPKRGCPFEDPMKSNGEAALHAFPNEKNWKIVVVNNKYPALAPGKESAVLFHHGIYEAKTGVGRHELIITRDHNKNFPLLSPGIAAEVLGIFQRLCHEAAEDSTLEYAVPFFNWGPLAGASLWHPHYQFLATPIVPARAAHSLSHAKRYFEKNHRCVRCDMVAFEKKDGTRIIAESKHMLAIAPYASKYPFEVSIVPKAHSPYFYKTSDAVIRDAALLLQLVMRRMKKNVNDPDMNMFIHEAPLDGKPHDYHHWHIEVIPRVTTPAGFEFSTGIYINSVEPEKAAAILKGR